MLSTQHHYHPFLEERTKLTFPECPSPYGSRLDYRNEIASREMERLKRKGGHCSLEAGRQRHAVWQTSSSQKIPRKLPSLTHFDHLAMAPGASYAL